VGFDQYDYRYDSGREGGHVRGGLSIEQGAHQPTDGV
jgi:hypothetical protein